LAHGLKKENPVMSLISLRVTAARADPVPIIVTANMASSANICFTIFICLAFFLCGPGHSTANSAIPNHLVGM
jgi:hypothetical protein